MNSPQVGLRCTSKDTDKSIGEEGSKIEGDEKAQDRASRHGRERLA